VSQCATLGNVMKKYTLRKLPYLLVAGLFSTVTAQAKLSDGLLNYWPLENDATDVAATTPGSASTTADDGMINGGVTFVDNTTDLGAGFGMAGSFSGTSGDNITIADSAASAAGGVADDIDRTASDMSISVWMKVGAWSTGWQAVLSHGEGTDYRIARRQTSNNLAGVAGTADIRANTVTVTPASGWHHVVITTVNGGNSIMYIDGVNVGSASGAAIAASGGNNNVLCIGCNPDNGREFNGLIDDIAMWDRALNATEVLDIYTTGSAGDSLAKLLDNTDDDNDGLPNVWEIANGFDINDATGINGASGDPDGDTLDNLTEFNRGTNPNLADSDGDTLRDDIETNTGTFNSPSDTGTDPQNRDSDGDGLEDNLEDGGGVFISETMTGSNPNLADTDADTMPDNYEVTNGLDPNTDDSLLDPDTDNLDNVTEFGLGTDPQDADSDDDTLNDDVEGTLGTNPLDSDSDNDGLIDGYETNNGTFTSATDTGSNPLVGDTDGDGTADGAEVLASRNPNIADGLTGGLGQRLVAYWNFDNNLDDIAHGLAAESAVADTGTFTGPETDVFYAAEGKFGSSSLEQNGVAGWVTVPASPDTLRQAENAVTVSAWIKVPAFSASWQSVISHGEGSQWRLARSNATSGIAWAGGAGDISGGDLADGEWHHIVGISDPVNAITSLYVDGALITTGAAPTIINAGNSTPINPDLFIGANPQSANREWNGQIDDLAIWGRALTAEEVTSIYDGGTGISIEALLGGGGGLEITDISYDASGANPLIDLTWNSRANASYGIYYSADLIDWSGVVQENIIGQASSTVESFTVPVPGAQKLFFRVEPTRPPAP
jgi:hypothetical protein